MMDGTFEDVPSEASACNLSSSPFSLLFVLVTVLSLLVLSLIIEETFYLSSEGQPWGKFPFGNI
jgi:hypothetical protein